MFWEEVLILFRLWKWGSWVFLPLKTLACVSFSGQQRWCDSVLLSPLLQRQSQRFHAQSEKYEKLTIYSAFSAYRSFNICNALPPSSLHLWCSLHTDGTVRLHREVVLLTDDRNLRVKALTRNVPVRDIPAFLSWAKVGWTGPSCKRKNPADEACLQTKPRREDRLKGKGGDTRGEAQTISESSLMEVKEMKWGQGGLNELSFFSWSVYAYVCVRISQLPPERHRRPLKSEKGLIGWK